MPMSKVGPVYFLLVDDLEENLLSLEALLRRDGLIMLRARSGEEALELLLQYEVGLALVDVQMPGMDGFELAELMRGTERTRRVPIIFLTAGNESQQRRFRGYEAGAVDFLHKPVEPDILRSKTEVFFQLARHQQGVQLWAEEKARLLQESEQYARTLKEVDQRKDEFLATLAHELRNPLVPIRNGLTIMKTEKDERRLEDLRGMMERQLGHLSRLIDDLLDVSRIGQGKIDLRMAPVDMADVLQAALETGRPLIEERGHRLVFEGPGAPLWVRGDLTRLAQVVGNLVHNAAKYTDRGGEIIVRGFAQDRQAVVMVRDNGIGVPPEMREHIFEPFAQGGMDMNKSHGGLGIGLSLVKRLVAMHGGQVCVESAEEGRGSVFMVSLPLLLAAEIPAGAAAETAAKEEGAQEALSILVVDDNLPSAQTTAWMLEMIGHEIYLAHDGPGALAAAQEHRPDVILLDIGLPGMSGYDVCRALRALPDFQNTLVVAQTGWGRTRDKQQAAEAGFDHHLIKPVNLEDFNRLLGARGRRARS